MRLYLPVTLLDVDFAPASGVVEAPRAHAVTPALRALFPDEDDEGLEYAAQLAAADDSLERVGAAAGAPRLRVVLSADVDDAAVDPLDDAVPSAVRVREPVPWSAVVCAHVDEPEAAGDVTDALTGDDDAVERLDERDLLWYDRTELGAVPR
ncbi:DUF6912 family protein [Cellulomonas sp. ATA003]|uniref:DUF6912 family protein n=1 Tax=Cellulomonas sp. ATA003 TaxID=3073064 RepID=UPI0028739F11|nr:hypothetical protein [Cellulomonas sp. ATA003]WNB86386.1 hypothetical protein REH70_03830 [Cellulomonas sp. ATA003]